MIAAIREVVLGRAWTLMTCRDKVDRGLTLFEPARLQEGRVAGERVVGTAFRLDL
jgi:hypothetical protein